MKAERQRFRDERPASQQIWNAAQGWSRMFAAPGDCSADAEELQTNQARWFRRLRRLLAQGVLSLPVIALLQEETDWDDGLAFGDNSALIAGLILVLAHTKTAGMHYEVFEWLLAGYNPDEPDKESKDGAPL